MTSKNILYEYRGEFKKATNRKQDSVKKIDEILRIWEIDFLTEKAILEQEIKNTGLN